MKKNDNRMLGALSQSQIYRDYERAFTRGTGLPLALHAPEMLNMIHFARGKANPFCALMAGPKPAAPVLCLATEAQKKSTTPPKDIEMLRRFV